ncbi:MAG: hypothetical protein JNJ61_23915 [Anaerolineae bacterium]|nr:hypothetical protein [Anaerolineae bacterium]
MQKWAVLLLMFGLFLAGCGGAAQTPTAIPTSTTIPTYEFVEPTAAPSIATAAAATAAANASGALDTEAVERGRGRYEALECGECHGANGEGTDEGSAMGIYAGTEEEFIAFMRSGGELGSDHQYSTNRLSDSGGRNLYQYLLSLRSSP